MAPAQGGKMFNNLIESSSHADEFKRRGSFFLFTIATYVLLFVIAGVASIYAYDARLEDQLTQEITMLSPVDFAPETPRPPVQNSRPANGNNTGQRFVRENPMASVNRPDIRPDTTSSRPNTNPPVPDRGTWEVGPGNLDPGPTLGNGTPGSGGTGGTPGGRPPVIEAGTPPPLPPPIVKPVPRIISKGPITGLALSLPKPLYPEIAKRAGANGPVNVQVLIDETGKVVSAKAVSGNPLLRAVAQQAAFGARFSPTRLGDQPVKVSGVITYNFLLH